MDPGGRRAAEEPAAIRFRPLSDADLPMLHRWLNEPGVVRWWEGDDVSWEGVVRDYGGPRDDGTEHWIATTPAHGDVGWIQCYAVADSPEEAAEWAPHGVHPTAAAIDYLVGEPSARGAGLGSSMIRAFVDQVVFGRHPGWTQACAAPMVGNVASWRALEKAGFRLAGVVHGADGPSRLMVLDRPTPA